MRRWFYVVLMMFVLAACGRSSDAPVPEGDAQSLLRAGQSALDSGNLDAATRNFQASIQASPSLDAYFGLGNAYARQDRLGDAFDAYNEALKINPNHTATLSNLGVVYYRQGQLSEAKNTFEKALGISPEDAETHYLLAATLLQMGDLEAAERSLLRALEIRPNLPEARFGLGMLRHLQGRMTEAIAEFEAFLSGPPAQDPRARTEAERILQELRGR